jgi:hypothetical protein
MNEYKPLKIVAYATSDNGDGYVQELGRYETIEDIEIFTSVLAKDVKIWFGYETDYKS